MIAGLGKPRPTRCHTPNTFPASPQGSPHRRGPTTHTHGARMLQSPICWAPSRAQQNPPPTQSGGDTGHGRQQAAHSPTTGPVHPLPSTPPEGRWGAECSAHTLLTPPWQPLHTEEEQQLGGSSTPRLPLRSLEKTFSLRAHHPSPRSSLSFGPTEVLHEPPVLSWGWEGSVVQVGRTPTQEHLHGQGRAHILSPARPHLSASVTRGMGMPLLPP